MLLSYILETKKKKHHTGFASLSYSTLQKIYTKYILRTFQTSAQNFFEDSNFEPAKDGMYKLIHTGADASREKSSCTQKKNARAARANIDLLYIYICAGQNFERAKRNSIQSVVVRA